MWIKTPRNDPVNLAFVQRVETRNFDNTDNRIIFFFADDSAYHWSFATKQDRDEVYQRILSMLKVTIL